MKVPVVLDPEIGHKISKTCQNCGKLMRSIHIGSTTVLMCRGEDHSTIVIEHPPGAVPTVFTRAGLRELDKEEAMKMILGDDDGAREDVLVCPHGCGFTTDSKSAYDKHIAFHESVA